MLRTSENKPIYIFTTKTFLLISHIADCYLQAAIHTYRAHFHPRDSANFPYIRILEYKQHEWFMVQDIVICKQRLRQWPVNHSN